MPVKGSQPIYPTAGEPAQLLSFNHEDEPAPRYLQPIFGNLLGSDWTKYDLRPLRKKPQRAWCDQPGFRRAVFGYDILVIVPDGTPSTQIR